MDKLDSLYRKLKQYSDFDAEISNAINFVETAEEIISEKDPESIQELLSYFDDETEYHWVFSIVGKKIFLYDSYTVTKSIIDCIPSMMEKAPEFLIDIFFLIWNTEECRKIFLEHINECDKEKATSFLDRIEDHYPELKEDFKIIRQKVNAH